MPTIHIPSHMRDRCGGRAVVEVPPGTLRSALDALTEACPGIAALILDQGRVRPDLAIAVNSAITENDLLERVADGDEIHLVPALGGGA